MTLRDTLLVTGIGDILLQALVIYYYRHWRYTRVALGGKCRDEIYAHNLIRILNIQVYVI